MTLMAAFVGVAPASAFRGSVVGRSLSTRRHVTTAPIARRPPSLRMMTAEEFGEWKKKADKKGSKATTAEKTNAEVQIADPAHVISEENTETNVTAFQPHTVDTTVFSDWVDQFDARLATMKQKVADVDTDEIKSETSAAAKSLVDNFLAGDWLNRGELWGALQVAFVYLMLKDPGNLDAVVSFFVGPVVLVAGAVLSIKGAWDLGRKQISLWPAPVPDGTLRTDGIYAYIRHPLYAGVLLASFGYAAATVSAERFALTFALLYALKNKVEVEEKFLEEAYGEEFDDYVEATPYKFIPKIF
ncbi:hypothetical protein MMPV_002156 [Pyropia vietnamensis]